MDEKVTVHGNPEKSVFGLIGSDLITDEEKLYIKVENDSKNTGWKEIPPTPSPTPTLSVTPTKTPIVTKQNLATPTPTPTLTRTPTITPTLSQTSPLTSPTPTSTRDKTFYNYSIVSSGPGQANRIDGPNNGVVNVGVTTMQLKAEPDPNGIFTGWSAPEGVQFSDPFSLNPIAFNFSVYDDFEITANFIPNTPQLPEYVVYGIANWRGILSYDYVNSLGQNVNYTQQNLVPGQVLPNAGCANQILIAYDGAYAELTDQSC